uniref:Uncharacterized protein n=1 Tax=Tanacetum cinerariifolium TaxID=118510 RepID=A0A6L2NWN4_TANCI|nr:hypothetical protein [Tanacetum cinerariifolium]
MKGSLRQFSVARTPQQNEVAERRNRTQIEEDNVNSTNNVNTVSSTVNTAGTIEVNVVGENISIELQIDPNMPVLEDVGTFNFSSDDEDDVAVADMNNLDTTIQVSHIPTTRIHKDHPLDQEELCFTFERLMHEKFQMSSIGELTFLLGLQVKQKKDAKTINGEVQLHAQVDKKEIVIIESSIRRDLQLADEEGIDCLPNSTIFKQLALIGSTIPINLHHTTTIIQPLSSQRQKTQKPRKPTRKDSQVPQPSGPTKSVADEAVHKELGDRLVRVATTASRLEAEQDSGNTLQSDEDRLKLDKLMALCTNLQNMVLDLEKTKTTQRNEIDNLKRRVKKLKKRNRSRTYKLKRLYKVGLTARVKSSGDEESLDEDASKQERMIDDIDADEHITLVSVQDDADKEMFDVNILDGEEMFVARKEISSYTTYTFNDAGKEASIDYETSPVIVEPLRIEFPFLEDQFQEDSPLESPMADNRTMAQLLQAPTEGKEISSYTTYTFNDAGKEASIDYEMKMETLFEPTSNKLLKDSNYLIHSYRVVCFETFPNGDALRKCILEGPYTFSTVVVLAAVSATKNSPAVPEHTTVETLQTMSPKNKAHYESEKEAIHLILTGIRDKIYSTVDACKIAQEM